MRPTRVAKLASKAGRMSLEEVTREITPAITSGEELLCLGDYHRDKDFKVLATQAMSALKEHGYEYVFLERDHRVQIDMDLALKLFEEGRIGLKELTKVITERDGKKHWDFTEDMPYLFSAIAASAHLSGMKVFAIDKEPGSPYDQSRSMKARNEFWLEKMLSVWDPMGEERGILFGGAYHLHKINLHTDQCEQAQGVDDMFEKATGKTSRIIATPEPNIRLNEDIAPRVDSLSINTCGTMSLPELSDEEIEAALYESLGEERVGTIFTEQESARS